ncbi:MAG: hypothetical protein J6I73_03200 [Treponema sp.]|nr:hypothetical protein [Treponema sp.]
MQRSEATVSGGEPWYMDDGSDCDVVVSTRVRLARNLANFLFPSDDRMDEQSRVQTLVFDSFGKFDNPDDFHIVRTETLDSLGVKILSERGVLDSDKPSGLVMRNDGRLSCCINSIDHVRIASFESGFNCEKALAQCRAVDDGLQNTLQFAASYEFGYLTAALQDVGSGMKISLRVHLPSISFLHETDSIFNQIREKDLSVFSVFGAGSDYGTSLGSYYEIATTGAANGNELDQLASIESAVKHLVETERKFRIECAENKSTRIYNDILRSFASAKFSMFLTLREAIHIISTLKWGLAIGIVQDMTDSVLHGLLYRVQEGHLEFLLNNGDFAFENDIKDDLPMKIERLRALIVQEALDGIRFVN